MGCLKGAVLGDLGKMKADMRSFFFFFYHLQSVRGSRGSKGGKWHEPELPYTAVSVLFFGAVNIKLSGRYEQQTVYLQ